MKKDDSVKISGLARNVKMLRNLKGETQTALAYSIGVAPAFISQIEAGVRQPSMKTLHALADHYNVSIIHLVGSSNLSDEDWTVEDVIVSLQRSIQFLLRMKDRK